MESTLGKTSFFNEMFEMDSKVRHHYGSYNQIFASLSKKELSSRQFSAEKSFLFQGITFNVYKDNQNLEQIFPFDIIPRIISADEWTFLETGLKQRVLALNLFLQDIYNDKKIIKDKIIPDYLVQSSKGYLKECEGQTPPQNIWCHISGIDLIRHSDGKTYILEDNLRCPSGVSYVLENREVMKRVFPELFEKLKIRPVFEYPGKLLDMLHHIAPSENPTVAVLTPGIYNSAYYEHSFLANQMGVHLVVGDDLVVQDDIVKVKTTKGLKKVDVIYRRIDDTFLDPNVFRKDSMLGVKGLMQAYWKGNVALANAPGTGIADDKAVYAYVPDFIKYYLGEDPILPNVPTYVCWNPKDMVYVLDHIDKLVVKAVNEAGGYGMLIGPHSTESERNEFREKVKANPRNYIAQPTMSLSQIPVWDSEGRLEGRHVDLRPYVIMGKETYIVPGGLTRVALKKGSLVVNSSQGGGSKDTWVLG